MTSVALNGDSPSSLLRSPNALRPLLEKAQEILEAHGLKVFGVSAWEPAQWTVLEPLGLSPYARSVFIGWDVAQEIPKWGNPAVRVEPVTPEQRPLLRRIQESSWHFFIPPDFGKQEVLIAWLGDRPVGSVYLNRATGHLDFGVHVVRDLWRQGVGTALLEAARQRGREWGLSCMMVTRVLRALTRINPADRQALDFYLSCGGVLLREYRGFRRRKRPRHLELPPLA